MPQAPDKSARKPKFSELFYNGITYTGVVISLLVFLVECILFGIDFFTPDSNVYLGMITYVLLPAFLLIGLLLIPLGAIRKWRRVKKGISLTFKPKPFQLNFAIPSHRNGALVFLVGTMILIIMTAVGSYQAFHYTESVHFCGKVCHTVMKPEYTTYLHSPHARVKCVECHIGSGADWYMLSKLSGLRQVYRTITDGYPKPIPTPVHNLRPAKETCEHCHWPEKLFGSVELRKTYFPRDDYDMPKWLIRMLIRVGQQGTQGRGIHAHMNLNNEVYYAHTDERRQVIPWVKKIDKDGNETIYTSPDSPYTEENPPPGKIRKMDCMDCHTRPAHHFKAPFELVNRALWEGRIDADIPSIKARATEALSGEYSSQEQAEKSIRETLTTFYQKTYNTAYPEHREKVAKATNEIISIYQKNFFPEMKARWDAYPDNIGHLISPGCFRCHDGEHRSPQGDVISRDCTICHTIIEQGPPDAVEKNIDGLPFRHPFEELDAWQEMGCHECHTGGMD